MADSTLGKFKDEVAQNPGTARLKEEAQAYLQARAQKAVTGLGHKLGDSVSKLANPSSGEGGGGLAGSLAKGGKALSEGKSPTQAAMKMGTSHLKDTIKDKVKGMFGKGRKGGGGGKSKSVTIVEDIDVGVPVREAYDQWTQFQEFSTFAKGVVSVEKADDTSSNWKVKVAKSTRSWKANVTEQVADKSITWTTEGAKGTVKGIVTFHKITDDLTRVLLVLEYFPKGLFEKTGNIWRAQGRRARLDLKLYRKFIMMRGDVPEGWRGEIRDGEVVQEHEEAVEEEERVESAEDRDETDEDRDEDEQPEGSEESEDAEDAEDLEGEEDEEDRPRDSAEYDDEEDEEDEDTGSAPRDEADEDLRDEDEDEDEEDDEADAEDEDEKPEDEFRPEDEEADEYDEEEEDDEPRRPARRRTASANR